MRDRRSELSMLGDGMRPSKSRHRNDPTLFFLFELLDLIGRFNWPFDVTFVNATYRYIYNVYSYCIYNIYEYTIFLLFGSVVALSYVAFLPPRFLMPPPRALARLGTLTDVQKAELQAATHQSPALDFCP